MGPTNRGRRAPVAALVGTLLTAWALTAAAKPAPTPKLKSSSVLILDQSDSSVLYSRNSDVAAPIASITKLMTALVVLDAHQPMDEPLAITESETDLPKTNISRLTVGTVLSRGDLMHLALMSTENRGDHERTCPRDWHDAFAFRRSDGFVERQRGESRGSVQAGGGCIA